MNKIIIEWNIEGGMPCGNYLQISAIETEKSVEEIFVFIVEKIEARVRLLNGRETISKESEFEVEGVKFDTEDFIWYDESGKFHRYYPDFLIGSVYIDTKNEYLMKIDEDKINRVRNQNNIDLRVIGKENITREYVKSICSVSIAGDAPDL